MGDDERVVERVAVLTEVGGQVRPAGGAHPPDPLVEPARSVDDVDPHHSSGHFRPRRGGRKCPLDGVVEDRLQVRHELAPARADVDDDRGEGAVLPDVEPEQGCGQDRPRRAVRGRREVRRRPAAGDVEPAVSGIQRRVPRLAPGNGIHDPRP